MLVPPLARLQGSTFISWRDDGLNEMLWAVLIRGNLDQAESLSLFREIITNARSNATNPNDTFVTHSVLSVMSEDTFDIWATPLISNADARELLRPLLFFESLPDFVHWKRHLKPPDPETHTPLLMKAVAACLDHQSHASTDIRWLKVAYMMVVCERIQVALNEERSREWIEELRLYPDYGNQRKVRPAIWALEIGFRGFNESERVPDEVPPALRDLVPAPWHEAFSKEGFLKTPCLPPPPPEEVHIDTDSYLKQLLDTYRGLHAHFFSSTDNTDVDARRDAAFGLVLYAITLTIGVARANVHKRPEGRIILRTIIETFITLHFLSKKDDQTIWRQFRNYGVGQSKLSLLKNLGSEDTPHYISLDNLHKYANDDVWQEYANINLKSWADRSLRKMSEEAGVKEFYDKYYDWSSGFVHGHWGAVRDSVFTVCLNPLHRMHRIPFVPRLEMPSVLRDACKLVNLMLEMVNHPYPTFKTRNKHQ